MIEKIPTSEPNVLRLRFVGPIVGSDVQASMQPELDTAKKNGCPMRVLCEVEHGPTRQTPEALLQEALAVMRYAGVTERGAVVSDRRSVREWAERVQPVLPFPMRTYPRDEGEQAVAWLTTAPVLGTVRTEYRTAQRVLLIRTSGPIAIEDLDGIDRTLDAWVHAVPRLRGVVLEATGQLRWSNLGALLRTGLLLRCHGPNVPRLAVVLGKRLDLKVTTLLCRPLRGSRIKVLPSERIDEALTWAAGQTRDERAGQPETPPLNGKQQSRQASRLDPVHQAGLDSFPASDPPGYSP